jgi:glycosyltransferase involved in cell wall biosynthesis
VPLSDHRLVYTDGIAREFSKNGHDVTVIVQKSENKSQFNDISYKIIQLKGEIYTIKGNIVFSSELYKYLKKNNFDVIHAKNPFSSAFAPLLLKILGKKFKLFYDMRGLWIDFLIDVREKRKTYVHTIMQYLENIIMSSCDGVIWISDEMNRVLTARGVTPKKIHITYGDGADVSRLTALEIKDIRKYLHIDGKVIGYLGSVSKGRSSEKIIEAFRYVKDEIQDCHLVFIGPVTHMDSMLEYVNKYNLNNSVHFTGFMTTHDEAISYTKSFDLALAYHDIDKNSINVMVPTKILEYLACGLPIIATNHIAHKNILTHNYSAFLTNASPKEFAEGIIKILYDNQQKENIAANAKKESEKYTFSNISKKLLNYYQN